MALDQFLRRMTEINNESIEDIYWIDDPRIFTVSSPWVATSVKSIRTNHSFPNWWPEFQDGTSGIMPHDFSDPNVDPPYNYYITYRINGDLYKVESVNHGAIERFPDSGKPAWYSPDGRSPDPTNPDELQYFIVKDTRSSFPKCGWRLDMVPRSKRVLQGKLSLSSCRDRPKHG